MGHRFFLNVFTALFILNAGFVCTSALAQKKDVKARLAELEEELALLRDVTGDAAKGANEAKLRLDKVEQRLDGLKILNENQKKLSEAASLNSQTGKKNAETIARLEQEIVAIKESLRSRINFTGQVRIRPQISTNTRDFRSDLDEDQNLAFSQRVRLGVDAAPLKWVEARLLFQDARVFGDTTGTSDRGTPARIHEGYIRFLPQESIGITVGRQEWEFGSKRIIGNDDWTQNGRAFDGLRGNWKYKNFIDADLLFAVIDERQAAAGDDWLFGGLYLSTPYLDPMVIDLYFLYNYNSLSGGQQNYAAIGGRLAGALPVHPALFFDLEATLQFGTVTEGLPPLQDNAGTDNATTIDNSHFAAAYHAGLGYKIPVKTDPSIQVFYEWISGDGNESPVDPGNDIHSGFIPMFGDAHANLGMMDLFSMNNIQDLGAEFKMVPVKGLDVGLQFHYFSLVDTFDSIPSTGEITHQAGTESASDIGSELDLFAGYQVNDNLSFGGGYSVLLPGKAIEDQIQIERVVQEPSASDPNVLVNNVYLYMGGDPAHWFWLQANLTF